MNQYTCSKLRSLFIIILMFPRFIELTNYQYRIEQEISSGATAKVFLAKRRPIKKKDLLIQIASTKTDFSYTLP